MKLLECTLLGIFLLSFNAANAEVVSSSNDHFVLRHEAKSELSPDDLWDRLIQPATWWHPDHTYSGDAANLQLTAKAGGLWREDWSGGSILHGQVVNVQPDRVLRLQAPFGPLQSMGVYTIWTISITPADEGSTVVFDEVGTGSSNSRLDEIAGDVDFVKGMAIMRLADPDFSGVD